MTTDGKVEIVENEMAKLSISCLGLSEVRWTGSMIIYSGSERKHEAGVGMILDKQTSVSMFGYNPISERLLTVRLAAKPWNVTLIQVYAPTNQATDQEKVAFTRACSNITTPRLWILLINIRYHSFDCADGTLDAVRLRVSRCAPYWRAAYSSQKFLGQFPSEITGSIAGDLGRQAVNCHSDSIASQQLLAIKLRRTTACGNRDV